MKLGRIVALMLLTLLQLLLSQPTGVCSEQSILADINTQIKALYDSDQTVRDNAAAKIRALRTELGKTVPGEQDQPHWEQQLKAIKIGTSKTDIEQLFPSMEGTAPTLGQGLGKTSVSMRLDNYWDATFNFDVSGSLTAAPELHKMDLDVWVPPRDTFSGTWTTYFVNGEKAQTIEYKDGEYNGTFTSYYSNGQAGYQQHYRDGIIDGSDLGWHRDGKQSYTGNYKNDRKDGLWIWWNPDGSKQKEQMYKDGKSLVVQ